MLALQNLRLGVFKATANNDLITDALQVCNDLFLIGAKCPAFAPLHLYPNLPRRDVQIWDASHRSGGFEICGYGNVPVATVWDAVNQYARVAAPEPLHK